MRVRPEPKGVCSVDLPVHSLVDAEHLAAVIGRRRRVSHRDPQRELRRLGDGNMHGWWDFAVSRWLLPLGGHGASESRNLVEHFPSRLRFAVVTGDSGHVTLASMLLGRWGLVCSPVTKDHNQWQKLLEDVWWIVAMNSDRTNLNSLRFALDENPKNRLTRRK